MNGRDDVKYTQAMFTFRRLFAYAVLMVPLAYFLGATFLSRRTVNYIIVGCILVVILTVYVLHKLLGRIWLSYRKWMDTQLPNLRHDLQIILTVVFAVLLLFPLIILVPIGAGISPVSFVVLNLILAAAFALQVSGKVRYPAVLRLDIPLVMIINIYAALFVTGLTLFGSTDATCREVESNPYLIPVVTRADIEAAPNIESCFPYDIKTDPDADMLFFTLKERRSGFIKKLKPLTVANDAICATRLSNPKLDAAMMIPIVGKSTATYPQRIAVDPKRKLIYVVVLDIDGNHSVKVVSYDGKFELVRSIDLDYEPIRVYVDDSRNRLIIVGYEGHIGIYDMETYRRTMFKKIRNLGFIGLLDTFVYNPAKDAYYASVVSDIFLLLRADDFKVLKRRKIGVPTIGLDYDQRTNRVYAAGTLTREILVLDGDTLNIVERIRTGTTVRELYIHRKLGLIVTAGYTDGHLDFYDLGTHERLARIFVGKLARGIHIEQRSGRVFVASSCGLFEVKLKELLASSGRKQPSVAH